MMINALHPMELTGRLFPVLAEDAIVIAISSWLGSIGAKVCASQKAHLHFSYHAWFSPLVYVRCLVVRASDGARSLRIRWLKILDEHDDERHEFGI